MYLEKKELTLYGTEKRRGQIMLFSKFSKDSVKGQKQTFKLSS